MPQDGTGASAEAVITCSEAEYSPLILRAVLVALLSGVRNAVDFSLSSEVCVSSVNRGLENLLSPFPSQIQWTIIAGINVPTFS